jgi:hypothetical protein
MKIVTVTQINIGEDMTTAHYTLSAFREFYRQAGEFKEEDGIEKMTYAHYSNGHLVYVIYAELSIVNDI